MIAIRKATAADIALIRDLAERSWKHGYRDVLSEAQISFMLSDLYAAEALERSMAHGETFYVISDNHMDYGFTAVKNEPGKLRIEKLYLIPQAQGRGLGRMLIDYNLALAKQQGLPLVELNVNRKNEAYNFYLKLGFTVFKEVDIPYHEFILDDYVMRKAIF